MKVETEALVQVQTIIEFNQQYIGENLLQI